jgi:hypothetical protein
LDDLLSNVCRGLFSREEFLFIETDIFNVLGCEIETPHIYEFVNFYFKALRLYIQCSSC